MGASRVQAGGRGGVKRRRPCVRREGSSGGSSLDPAWRKGLWVGAQARVCEGRPGNKTVGVGVGVSPLICNILPAKVVKPSLAEAETPFAVMLVAIVSPNSDKAPFKVLVSLVILITTY